MSHDAEKEQRSSERLEAAKKQANEELEARIAEEILENPMAIHDPDDYARRRRESLEGWLRDRVGELLRKGL